MARKYFKLVVWGAPGAIWWPSRENTQGPYSGDLLGPVGGRGVKMFKISVLGASWGHLGAVARKFFK